MIKLNRIAVLAAAQAALSACGGSDFVALPELEGVKSWLLAAEDAEAVVFAPDVSATLDWYGTAVLMGLPVTVEQLGVSGPVMLDSGRVLPVAAAFVRVNDDWMPTAAPTVRLPFFSVRM